MAKKEVRIFLIAVLAVAFVSLVTQIFAGLASAITMFADAKLLSVPVYGTVYSDDYVDLSAAFMLVISVLALAFAIGMVLMFALKKKKKQNIITGAVLCGIAVIAFIVLTAVLWVKVPADSGYESKFRIRLYDYELFQQFLTVGLADAIAIAIAFTAWLLLTLAKPTEQAAEEGKQISAPAGSAEEKAEEPVSEAAQGEVQKE